MKLIIKFLIALCLVTVMCKLAFNRGKQEGERGIDYWTGWHDAMQQTRYGTVAVFTNGEFTANGYKFGK